MALIKGQIAEFIEHWALVTDEDSLMEEPVIVTMITDTEDVEQQVERLAVKRAVLALNGNTLSAEYHGTTGRIIACEVQESKNLKLGWYFVKELTPAIEDLQSYYKM